MLKDFLFKVKETLLPNNQPVCVEITLLIRRQYIFCRETLQGCFNQLRHI